MKNKTIPDAQITAIFTSIVDLLAERDSDAVTIAKIRQLSATAPQAPTDEDVAVMIERINAATAACDANARTAARAWDREAIVTRERDALLRRLEELHSMHTQCFPKSDACIECIIFDGEGEYERDQTRMAQNRKHTRDKRA